MAKIIPFPKVNKQAYDLVEEIIATRLHHKHPEVLRCLKTEMTELVKKYYPIEDVTLSVMLPRDLREDQFSVIEKSIKQTLGDHNRRMSSRANQLFLDLCLSRMTICELRHQMQDDS